MAAIKTSISPWLTVSNGKKAIQFYQSVFGAVEIYHLDGPDDTVVSKLSIDGAEFWLSDGDTNERESNIRLVLTVGDPETVFSKAIEGGATEVFPVGEGHGWKLGRVIDPFGHHWEIGHEIDNEKT